ncbi:MAG: hypothetical protein ACKOSS_09005 [Planctomycetia bacterium]
MAQPGPAPATPAAGPRALAWLAAALLAALPPTAARADDEVQRRLERAPPATVALELAAGRAGNDSLLWVGLGQVARFTCDLEAARARAQQALRHDPLAPQAHALAAEVLLLEARAGEALAATARGLALPGGRQSPDLWRVRALALVELRRHAEGREAAARACALDPHDARALSALARAAFHLRDMAAASTAYRLAADLDGRSEEANLRLGQGFGPAVEGRPWEQDPRQAPWRAAMEALEAGESARAIGLLEPLATQDPGHFAWRLGLGNALVQRRRSLEVRAPGALAPRAAYALLPAPALEGLEQVLPDAARLSPARRHALLVAAAPMRPWWPALVRAGARHDLLAAGELLSDRAERGWLAARLTFDGRRYAHLRGSGGLHGATGVEKLDEACDLGFHTLAHELAHQLLAYALPPASVARVKVLYARALAEDRCLDAYAASDVDEYFAQGYEAFVSHAKRGCLKETERHVRAELRLRDPALYDFLVEHLDLAHELPAAMERFVAALGTPPAGGAAVGAEPAR